MVKAAPKSPKVPPKGVKIDLISSRNTKKLPSTCLLKTVFSQADFKNLIFKDVFKSSIFDTLDLNESSSFLKQNDELINLAPYISQNKHQEESNRNPLGP